jgi:LysM repeat protein
MKKQILWVIVLTASLLTGAFWSLPTAQAAGLFCPFFYTVRPGDTLSSIAARAGINPWELGWRNGLRNIHYIYVGQVLCLPRPIAGPPKEPEPPVEPLAMSSLDLVVQYTFVPTAETGGTDPILSRAGQAGLRLSYPLMGGQVISTYAGPQDVWENSFKASSPLLWLARLDEDSTDYALVAIGDPSPLLDLQMATTRTITEVLPELEDIGVSEEPVEALLDDSKTEVDLHAELIGVDGSFIPANIVLIDYMTDITQASQKYRFPGFALHTLTDPATEGYHLFMVLNEGGAGPPGPGYWGRCGSWAGGGYWSGWMRSWYGCSGYRYAGYRYPRYATYRRGF